MRLALIYALLDWSDVIGEPHLRAALALATTASGRCSSSSAPRLGDRLADDIVEALRQSKEGLTRKELSDHFGERGGPPPRSRPRELLRRNGLATCIRENTGGHPKETWRYEQNELNEFSPPPARRWAVGKYLDLADQAIRRLDAEREEVAGGADVPQPSPYADGDRCDDCGARSGAGTGHAPGDRERRRDVDLRDCVSGETEKRRMRARGVAI